MTTARQHDFHWATRSVRDRAWPTRLRRTIARALTPRPRQMCDPKCLARDKFVERRGARVPRAGRQPLGLSAVARRTGSSGGRAAAMAWRRRLRLDALEILLDFPPGQPQHDRPAVRADRRVRRAPQFVEQVLHLLARQRIVRLHRRVTRHRGGHLAQRVVDAGARARDRRDRAATARSASSLRA